MISIGNLRIRLPKGHASRGPRIAMMLEREMAHLSLSEVQSCAAIRLPNLHLGQKSDRQVAREIAVSLERSLAQNSVSLVSGPSGPGGKHA